MTNPHADYARDIWYARMYLWWEYWSRNHANPGVRAVHRQLWREFDERNRLTDEQQHEAKPNEAKARASSDPATGSKADSIAGEIAGGQGAETGPEEKVA